MIARSSLLSSTKLENEKNILKKQLSEFDPYDKTFWIGEWNTNGLYY